jgi:hypothetical protein
MKKLVNYMLLFVAIEFGCLVINAWFRASMDAQRFISMQEFPQAFIKELRWWLN